MSTTPATVASALLAVRYAGATASLEYLLNFAKSRGLVPPPDAETVILGTVIAFGLLAALWLWTAVCCARGRASAIVLGTIGLTVALLAYGLVNHLSSQSPLDALEIVKTLVEAALVAIVIAWRPRRVTATPSAPVQPAPAS